MHRALLLPSIMLAATLSIVPAAHAGVLELDGETLMYTAYQGERNNVILKFADHPADICGEFGANCIEVYDSAGLDLWTDACRYRYQGSERRFALCPPLQRVDALLGDGDDRFNGYDGDSVIDAGPGRDQVDGGGGDDEIHGGPDSDALAGGAGDDRVTGDDGDDWLESLGWHVEEPARTLAGQDKLDGGPGTERVDYSQASGPVQASLDGVANDGPRGETDDLRNIEAIAGGEYDDTLAGDAAANNLDGNGGNDTLIGNGGDDTIDGDAGNDVLHGDAGDDDLLGGNHDDTLDGGPGTDTLKGDKPCSITFGCNGGADLIQARDGQRDSVTCGVGADRAIVDAIDVVGADLDGTCETIERDSAAAQPGGSPPGAGAVTIASQLDARFTHGARTRVRRLRLHEVPAGATVTVACSARRCLHGTGVSHHRRALASLDLRARLRRRALPAGTRLEVSVTAPDIRGRAWTYRTRRGQSPLARRLCIPYGTNRPTSC